MIAEDQVKASFRAMLGREPESDAMLRAYMALPDIGALITTVVASVEFQRRMHSPLWHWHASFDAAATVLAHEARDRAPVAGHRVNYLGVAVNIRRFLPDAKRLFGGVGDEMLDVVEPPPMPANWHADIAEFAAALRAVEHAGESFTMAELGCGWGCWMNITGVAARRMGKTPFLIGVEGDPGHIAFAEEALATNGFAASQRRLLHGVAAGKAGPVFFPKQSHSGGDWGLEPILAPNPADLPKLRKDKRLVELPAYTIDGLMADRQRLDLLHIDIQGGEADLVRDSLATLDDKVAYLVIGTHSRPIEGELIRCLLADGGWELEIERPCLFSSVAGPAGPVTGIDGVQGWRNRRLAKGGR